MGTEGIDLLTLYPRVECTSLWERAILPWLGVLSAFRMDRVNDPASKEAMAFGYFLLFRMTSFKKIGGYEAIKDKVGEDWLIARTIKGKGLCLRMLLGIPFVTKRFGPSLAEIWQGFTKNFILIMEGNKVLAALAIPLIFYYLLFTTVPWLVLGLSPLMLIFRGWDPLLFLLFLLSGLQLVILLGVRSLLKEFFRLDVSAPYLQPLGGLVVSAMGFTAIYRTLAGKGIVWRGRSYKKF